MKNNILAAIIVLGLIPTITVPAPTDPVNTLSTAVAQELDQKIFYLFLANLGIQAGALVLLENYYLKLLEKLPTSMQKIMPYRSNLRNASLLSISLLPLFYYIYTQHKVNS